MKIGLNLYGPCAKQAMKEGDLLVAAKVAGIDFVEPCVLMGGLTHCNPSFWTMSKFENLYEEAKNVELDVVSIHVVTESLENAVDEMFLLANEYGIKQFVIGMPNSLDEATIRERALVLYGIADRLKSCGARILIHNNQPDTAVKINGKTALETLIELCDGRVSMQLDLGWCAAGGEDPIEFFKRNEANVASLHFKDFINPGASEPDVTIGSGSIDTLSAIKIAAKLGIPMLIDQDSYSDIRVDLKKSYDFVNNG